ncbi:hypothetical protein [Candidatus Phytoplasma solani]|uniref:hypothetical protein n=1 Tax=Candidatus Phytoplasma solani TaxID=69896 RepID=UPI00358F322F
MISLFKKILSLPALFVKNLINPSKRVKHLVKNHDKSDSGFIHKKIAKCLKTTKEQKVKSLQIATYKSVFWKFTSLFLVWLISIFLIFIYYRTDENRNNLMQTVIKMAGQQNFTQPIDTKFFPMVFFTFLFGIIGLLWFISFLCWTALLKVTNYFLAIGYGFILGSCYVVLDSPIFLIFLFVIPLSVTVLVLGLITYLHHIKKIFKINDQVKQKFVTLFTLVFFLGIFMQVFYFLVNVKFSCFSPILILIIVISLLLYILEFVLAAFMWAIALDQLDQYVEQKLPKKYESLLVALMLISFMGMFAAIFEMILFILRLIGIDGKKK